MEKKMEEFLREKKAGMNQQGTSTSTNQPNQDDPDAGEGASRQHQRGPFTTTGTATTSFPTTGPEETSEPKTIFLHRRSKSDLSVGGSSNSSASDLSSRARDDYSQHSDDGIAYDNPSDSSSNEALLNAMLTMDIMADPTHRVLVSEAQRSEGVLDLRKKLDEEKEYHGPVKRQKDDKDKDKEPPSSSKKSKRKE
ncbi:uncharacterized protein LOC108738213 isoform X1 [Agrilus planipennis]|uniref:Uncharacterized protein LOC108738213 isoform X1 n=1 Tax=Agrilus planipennis TaxID=224129 RepID=A0A1W4X3V5_AGRPL|nr:uncharacterized protein LOC108738213 isoform X1 [Agrilus planipennis]